MAPYEEVRVSLTVFSEVSYIHFISASHWDPIESSWHIQTTLVRVVNFSDPNMRCKSDLSCSWWPHTYLLTPGDQRGNSSASSHPFPPFYFLSLNFSSGTLSVCFLLFSSLHLFLVLWPNLGTSLRGVHTRSVELWLSVSSI